MKHRLIILISLCLIIGTVCFGNIYERLSDDFSEFSKFGINEGYGEPAEEPEEPEEPIHIINQKLVYKVIQGASASENAKIKVEYQLEFDQEVSAPSSTWTVSVNNYTSLYNNGSSTTSVWYWTTYIPLSQQIVEEAEVIGDTITVREDFVRANFPDNFISEQTIDWSNFKSTWTPEELSPYIQPTITIVGQDLAYEAVQSGSGNYALCIRYTIAFSESIEDMTYTAIDVDGYTVTSPDSSNVATFTFNRIIDLGTTSAPSNPEVVTVDAESVRQCFEGSAIDWSNLKTSWAQSEVESYYVHIIQEYWYTEGTQVYYMVAFDSPVRFVGMYPSGAYFYVTGLNTPRQRFTLITTSSSQLANLTGYSNGTLWSYSTTSANIRRITDLSHEYVATNDLRNFIVGVNNTEIFWGSDFLTRSIPKRQQ